MPAQKSLMIFGPGELGSRVAQLWKRANSEGVVYLMSKRSLPERSTKWKDLGYQEAKEDTKADDVVYCAPPSDDLVSSMSNALSNHWTKKGQFVFTSSAGVYLENNQGTVDEDSPVKTPADGGAHSKNSDLLVESEKLVLEAGGVVLRLGGLYHLKRGAHNFWLTSGRSPYSTSPHGLINLIHYDDVASAVMCTLTQSELVGQLLLLSDGVPVSRGDICVAAAGNDAFAGQAVPQFNEEAPKDGKRYNVTRARQALKGWNQVHKSFADFCANTYKQETNVPILNNISA